MQQMGGARASGTYLRTLLARSRMAPQVWILPSTLHLLSILESETKEGLLEVWGYNL